MHPYHPFSTHLHGNSNALFTNLSLVNEFHETIKAPANIKASLGADSLNAHTYNSIKQKRFGLATYGSSYNGV